MKGDSIVRMAELDIDPSRLYEYRAILTEEIEASLALEPGVLMLNAVALRDHPEKIRIMEVYASQQAYESHLQTPHFLKYKTLTAGMVTSLRLIAVDPVCMLAKPASSEFSSTTDDQQGEP